MPAETDLIDLRSDARTLDPGRRDEMAAGLMRTVRDDAARGARRPARRRRVTGLLAGVAALAAVGSVTAIALRDRSQPDAKEAASVNASIGASSPSAVVHLEGWRPELAAESVRCELPQGSVETVASEFPLDAPLTSAQLAVECASGNDLVRTEPLDPAQAVACVETGNYPRPVIRLNGATCAPGGLRALTNADLATLNRLRAFDVAFMAGPTGRACASRDAELAWVDKLIGEFGRPLRVETRLDGDPATTCYSAQVDWAREVVLVSGVPAPPK